MNRRSFIKKLFGATVMAGIASTSVTGMRYALDNLRSKNIDTPKSENNDTLESGNTKHTETAHIPVITVQQFAEKYEITNIDNAERLLNAVKK